jgi:hypothetical protein
LPGFCPNTPNKLFRAFFFFTLCRGIEDGYVLLSRIIPVPFVLFRIIK